MGWHGRREDSLVTRLTSVREIEGQFGSTWLISFEDSVGNSLKWFASRKPEVLDGDSHEGETFKVSGRVKKHDTYKDRRQTLLTRCAMVKVKTEQSTVRAKDAEAY